MKFKSPLIPARFVNRPNRFLTRVNIDGQIVDSHLPDPGRLQELLLPNAELRVQPVPRESKRKTRYTTTMVKSGDIWVSLISSTANRLAQEWLRSKTIPFFKNAHILRAEIPYQHHRFDFLLQKNDKPYYLEVKSVTFVDRGVAKFPDAVTARGARHATMLATMKRQGIDTGILFVCQRSDVASFTPMWNRDATFAKALFDAWKTGVEVCCVSAEVSEKGIRYCKEIPVYLSPPDQPDTLITV